VIASGGCSPIGRRRASITALIGTVATAPAAAPRTRSLLVTATVVTGSTCPLRDSTHLPVRCRLLW
jgi:hypothetical protein